MRGEVTQEIDLTGLNNFAEMTPDPSDSGVLLLKARKTDGGFSAQLYRISRDTGKIETVREGLSLFQVGIHFSPDGRWMAYAK